MRGTAPDAALPGQSGGNGRLSVSYRKFSINYYNTRLYAPVRTLLWPAEAGPFAKARAPGPSSAW
jgi:hypothetical protein